MPIKAEVRKMHTNKLKALVKNRYFHHDSKMIAKRELARREKLKELS